MRPLFEDFDDMEDFDFADNAAVGKAMRAQKRDERRAGSKKHVARHAVDPDDDFDDFEYDDDDFSDYDDDEFDKYSGIGLDH
jgi:hypothetical protein